MTDGRIRGQRRFSRMRTKGSMCKKRSELNRIEKIVNNVSRVGAGTAKIVPWYKSLVARAASSCGKALSDADSFRNQMTEIVFAITKWLSQAMIVCSGIYGMFSDLYKEDHATHKRTLTRAGRINLATIVVGFLLFGVTEYHDH